MNPIYRFFMSINGGTEFAVNPVYKDLSKEYAKETNQLFFRAKLSGKLTFVRQDYTKIQQAYFDSLFLFRIEQYINGSWTEYWRGTFYKTDCEFDSDSETCKVTPNVVDQYSKILAGYENEMDLIQLAPDMQRINYWKRPVFQFYIGGANTIGCFQMGEYWEQEAEPTTDYNTLRNTYKFGQLRNLHKFKILDSEVAAMNCVYWGLNLPNTFSGYYKDGYTNGYKLKIEEVYYGPGYGYCWDITLLDSNNTQLFANWGEIDPAQPIPSSFEMSGMGDYLGQTITVSYQNILVYGRIVNDVGPATDPQNYLLPDPDITDTSGYKYGEPMGTSGGGQTGFEGFVVFQYEFQDEPNQFGQYYENGVSQGYYVPSYGMFHSREDCLPISRNSWGEISVWMDTTKWALINLNNTFRCKAIVLKDAYSFASSIQKIVKAIDPSLDFQLTNDYSYLMATLLEQILYITPKTNILVSEYDHPASQAPVTLKTLMDGMRDMFNAYWFIEDGKFKIERVDYFANGRSYTPPTPSTEPGIDLTQEIVTRNGKNWAYCSSKWKYEKSQMPERYEFGWMDDATAYFNGLPMVMLSAFVSKGQIEQKNVAQISTDINLMLIAPGGFSKDGFAMLSCNALNEVINLKISDGYYIQNGMLSFTYLEKHYLNYELPCWYFKYGDDGSSEYAQSIKKTRIQDVTFPADTDPDLFELIKTDIGMGSIEKLTINLSSRQIKATLGYKYGSTE